VTSALPDAVASRQVQKVRRRSWATDSQHAKTHTLSQHTIANLVTCAGRVWSCCRSRTRSNRPSAADSRSLSFGSSCIRKARFLLATTGILGRRLVTSPPALKSPYRPRPTATRGDHATTSAEFASAAVVASAALAAIAYDHRGSVPMGDAPPPGRLERARRVCGATRAVYSVGVPLVPTVTSSKKGGARCHPFTAGFRAEHSRQLENPCFSARPERFALANRLERSRVCSPPKLSGRPNEVSTPREIRTPDIRFRRPTLYPAELWAQTAAGGLNRFGCQVYLEACWTS
jgi:hypothetical protein